MAARSAPVGEVHASEIAERHHVDRSAPVGEVHASEIAERLARHVDRGEVPGFVAAVWRGGRLQIEVRGTRTAGGADEMTRDTIFRITSMTKPITAVAAMILVDDGILGLDEPVGRWLPELANRRVLRRLEGPLEDTVPAARAITVRDLLTFRPGFGMFWAPPDAHPIQRAASARGLCTLGPPKPATALAPGEWLRRFAELPLMAQPGERWLYNTGAHLLGVLLAHASGRPLETLLRERLFEPLGMKDTSFHVPAAKLDRLPPCYMREPSGSLVVYDEPRGQWSAPPAFPDAAAGLVSTADDFLAFARMLLDGGSWQGRPLLSARALEQLTTNQLTPAQSADAAPFLGRGRGWGFGVSTPLEPGARGGYGWSGGFGTSWWNEPTTGTIGLLLTQRMWESPQPPAIHAEFRAAVDALG